MYMKEKKSEIDPKGSPKTKATSISKRLDIQDTSYTRDKKNVPSMRSDRRGKPTADNLLNPIWKTPVITAYKNHIELANESTEDIYNLEDVEIHASKYKQMASRFLNLFNENDEVFQFILRFFVEHAVLSTRRILDYYIEFETDDPSDQILSLKNRLLKWKKDGSRKTK